jgi:hypothetical protein
VSSIVRITSICPLPKMLPDHALADRLERLEWEYELLKESQQPDSRRRKRTPAHLVGVPDAKGGD